MIRLATFETDYWRLESAEERNKTHPDTFKLPDLEVRQSLTRGAGVKLLFQFQALTENGDLEISQTERMWVIVKERIGDYYLGILDSDPAQLEDENFLPAGSEIYFKAEHITEIDYPPEEYLKQVFG